MGVGLQLEGPVQLLNSMALIRVVEFQIQEWGAGWSFFTTERSSGMASAESRSGGEEQGLLAGGPWKEKVV